MIIELYWPQSRAKAPAEVNDRFAAYRDYLETVADRLPESVMAIATAPWHYDPSFHECPHDAWVKSVRVNEPAEGTRLEKRALQIEARLLGAYQDGEIQILYEDVRNYSLSVPGGESNDRGHGDWLVDEIRLSERGMVVHEVVFSRGRWLIECADIEWRWRPTFQAPASR